jgi:hypothetical protein
MTNNEEENADKKSIDELTYDFFDNLYKLEMECKLKKDANLLDNVISEYKKLIKYYKKKKDKREEDYKYRLNMFVTDPKIIQISKLKKSNKKKGSITFDLNDKDKNFKKSSNLLKTKTFLNVVEEGKEHLKNSENAFNNEMQKQDEKFKSKLRKFKKSSTMKSLKKKSSILSFSSFFDNNKNDHLNNSNIENEPTSMRENKKDKNDNLILELNLDYDSNSEKNETKNILDESKSLNQLLNNTDGSILLENDNSIYFVSENDENETSNLKKSFLSSNNGMFNLLEKYEDIGANQKRKILSLKDSLDEYLNKFNNYIHNDLIKRTTDKIQRIFKEKFDNYKKTNEDYNNDIKDLEDQKNSINKDDPQYTSLIIAIDMLKDEMQNELDKFDDQYNAKILKFKKEFQTDEVKNDPGITLLEEQLRLGVINTLQELIFPKKNEIGQNDDLSSNNIKSIHEYNDNNNNNNNEEEKEVEFENEKITFNNEDDEN